MTTATTQPTVKIDRVQIGFDRKASVFATLCQPFTGKKAGEFLKGMTHTKAFQFLEANRVEAFVFRIDPCKSPKSAQKIIDAIESMGFEVTDSEGHYNRYAFK